MTGDAPPSMARSAAETVDLGQMSPGSDCEVLGYQGGTLCTTIAGAGSRNRGEHEMAAGSRPKPLVIALAVAVVAIIAYWGFTAHKKRELDNTITASVQDASQRLRSALTVTAGPAEAITMQVAERISTDAEEVDRRLRAIKKMESSSNFALVDVADSYLLTVREILRRLAGSHRNRLLLAESTQALRDHIRIDTRTGTWVSEAVRSKARMDKDFRDYRIDSEMADNLLQSFLKEEKKAASFLGRADMIEEKLIDDARSRASTALKQAAVQTQSFRLH